jgi:hypothetical protein
LGCLLALLGLVLPARGGEAPLSGTWKLSVVSGLTATERPLALIRIAKENDQWTGAMVATPSKGLEVKSVTLKDGTLRVVLTSATGAGGTFEGQVAPGGKVIKGSYGSDTALVLAALSPTREATITGEMTVNLDVPPLKAAAALNDRARMLLAQYAKSQDKEEKARLLREYQDAMQAARKEAVGPYREVVARHADSPVVVDVVLTLLRNPARVRLTADEARAWAAAANKVAAGYGRRLEMYVAAEMAKAALPQEGLAALAAEQAARAERLLDARSSLDRQTAVLETLEAALQKLGKAAEARAVAAKVGKLQEALDGEYLKTVPSFKGKEFAGRKGTSERVAVMELFTGAQCPPCVAADVAFDVLTKTYQPRDVVLIQYHLHIPGPDPMTNPATEARWDYYRKLFPNQVRGVPTALFNGKVLPGGGGPMQLAEKKYHQYCQAIEPLLETPAGAKLSTRAHRTGDEVTIEANVTELKNGGNVRLRLLLVEETIRYVGGNKIRFHHQVVRAFPGGVEGVAVKDKTMKHTASVRLEELRQQLNTYLDNYAATKRPFPKAERPLHFANLRVIGLLQNDDTAEILQATQVEVASSKEGR